MLKTHFKVAWLLIAFSTYSFAGEPVKYNLGTTIDKSIYRNWDIDVEPSSTSLPEGSGTAEAGEKLFASQCAICHGKTGEGVKILATNGAFPRLIKDGKTLKDGARNIGTYWPYATTLFDYINRAMPITIPGSLTADEVYALVAFLLYENDIIRQGVVISGENIKSIRMPNRDGFVCDDRPVVTGVLCMENCKIPTDNDFQIYGDMEALAKIPKVPETDCYLN